MKIKTIDRSPWPGIIKTMQTTNLIFNQSERNTLSKAREVIAEAGEKIAKHFDCDSVAEVGPEMIGYFMAEFAINDLLNDSEGDGLILED